MTISATFSELTFDELFSIDGGGDRAGLIVSGCVTIAGGIVACCTGVGAPAGAAVIATGLLFFAAAAAY